MNEPAMKNQDFQAWFYGTGQILENWARQRGHSDTIAWRMNDPKVARDWDLWHTRACYCYAIGRKDQAYQERLTKDYQIDSTDPEVKSWIDQQTAACYS